MSKRSILVILALSLLAEFLWIAGGGLRDPRIASDSSASEVADMLHDALTLGEPASVAPADTPDAVRQPLAKGDPRAEGRAYVLTGKIETRVDVPIDGARIEVYAGTQEDHRPSLSSIMDLQATGSIPSGSFGFQIEGEPIASAQVAPDGSFAIRGLRQRHLRLALRHDFYALTQARAVHVGEDVQRFDAGSLDSYCGGLILGRIVGIEDPSGKKIKAMVSMDPMLVIKQPKSFFAAMGNATGQESNLDESGSFELHAVWPSPQVRLIQQDSEGYARSEVFPLRAGETREVLLQAAKAAYLEVEVRDEDGAGVSDARVSASPTETNGDLQSRARLTRSEHTDSAGRVRITGLIPGVYSLHVQQLGLLDYMGEHPSGERVVEVTLHKGASITGTVVDSAGTIVAGAQIIEVPVISIPLFGDISDMVGASALARGAKNSKIVTDAAGRFEITGLPEKGSLALGAYHEDFVGGVTSGISPGDRNVRIRLQRAGSIRGRVLGLEKQPVPDFEVRTTVKVMMFMDRPTSIEHIEGSADGEFHMDSVPPGKATLRIEAKGYGAWEKRVTVEEAKQFDLGEIQLSAAAKVRGRVLSPDGLPVANARVSVKRGGIADNPMLAMFSPQNETRSDHAGFFELAELHPGPITLLATAEGHASGASDRLRLAAGQVLEGVEITLSAGGSIEGRLLLPEGALAENWEVFASRQQQGTVSNAELRDDLSFGIDHLDPGSYQIQAMDMQGYQRMQSRMARETIPGRVPNIGKLIGDAQDLSIVTRARVRQGEVTRVILDGSDLEAPGTTLTCRVWIGDELMSEGFVEVQTLTGNQPRIKMGIIEDGELRLTGLGPGVIQLQARSGMTLGPLGAPHSVEIPAGVGTHACEWHIPGGSISGQVRDANSDEPVAGAMVRVRSEISLREGRDQDFGFSLSDGEGNFSFRGLAAGTYSLIAESSLFGGMGNSGTRVRALELGANSSLSDLILRIEPGAGISIHVAGPDGSPIPGALILAVDGAGQPIGSMPIARSNSHGEAWLAGLPSGATRILARAEGLAPSASALQKILPGGHGAFRVNLARGTPVTVKLVDRQGTTLRGARLSARWPNGPWLPTALLAPRELADGSLDLGPLPDGEIEFSVTHPRAQFTARRMIPRGHRATLVISPE